MEPRKCPECGAAFLPRYGSEVCCCDTCKRVRLARQRAEERARRAGRARRADKEKARRRAAFCAARDRAFEETGLPAPKIEVRGGVRVETRGRCAGGGHGEKVMVWPGLTGLGAWVAP